MAPVRTARKMNYAVLDTETTGIYPGGHDRIIELAIIRLGPGLEVEREYSTLLNPGRDVGPTWLHGIRAGDILEAPAFEDIAGSVVDLLSNTVVVGHNVSFDLRFVEAEFARTGHPISRPSFFDTMAVAVRMGASSRQLEEVCELFGIPVPDTHSALGDARATAALFVRCVEHFGGSRIRELIRGVTGIDSEARNWPTLKARRQPLCREKAVTDAADRGSYLATLVRDLPVSESDPGDWQGYFGVLDRVLEDRRITDDEVAALREVAQDCGMTGDHVRAANRAYLSSLVSVALADDHLSASERRDLEEVSGLLDLASELPGLIAEAPQEPDGPAAHGAEPLEGRSVCFTGALNAIIDGERVTRGKAIQIASENGMVVKKSVTKKLDYLVVADPDSLSGKAKKARDYGTRIIAEAVFWNLMGVDTEG
jgi:DNA polymerase III subunit epsilon